MLVDLLSIVGDTLAHIRSLYINGKVKKVDLAEGSLIGQHTRRGGDVEG